CTQTGPSVVDASNHHNNQLPGPGPLSPVSTGHITLQPLTVRQSRWPGSGKSRAPKNFLGTIRRRIFWAARARTASARVVSVAPGAGIPLLRRESSVTSINAPDHAPSAGDRELQIGRAHV